MGLYDWINIEAECPKCKRKSLMEFQTYDLGRTFSRFNLGDEMDIRDPMSLISHCRYCHCIIHAWGKIQNKKLKLIEIFQYTVNLKDNIVIK